MWVCFLEVQKYRPPFPCPVMLYCCLELDNLLSCCLPVRKEWLHWSTLRIATEADRESKRYGTNSRAIHLPSLFIISDHQLAQFQNNWWIWTNWVENLCTFSAMPSYWNCPPHLSRDQSTCRKISPHSPSKQHNSTRTLAGVYKRNLTLSRF